VTLPADYIGRRVDVLAFQGATATGSALLEQALLGSAGASICAGVQKLAQRWVIAFLQDKGSAVCDAGRGATFMPRAKAGLLRTELDVRQAFAIAAADVSTQLKEAEAEADPADERLDEAELLDIGLVLGGLTLSVRVTSLAGNSRTPLLPIPLSP